MSDPLGVGVDGDTATHVGGGSMLLLTAFGMARSMFNAAKDRDEAAKERAAAEIERRVLLAKVEEMLVASNTHTLALRTLESASNKQDRELALVTQIVQQRSVAEDVLAAKIEKMEARLDRLNEKLTQIEVDRAGASGIRKASEGA